MKNIFIILLACIPFFTLGSVGFAAEKAVTHSHSYESHSEHKVGAGFATATSLTGSSTALTGWFEIDSANAIQPLFTIPATTPNFEIVFGAIYKHTLFESQGGAGFHAGGGIAVGSLNKDFAMGMAVIGGIHVPVPGAPHVVFHFDGGPAFQVLKDNNNFSVAALSPTLGASVLYLF